MNKTTGTVVAAIVVALLLFGAGFGVASWRYKARIATADAREKERTEKIAANDAASNKLRGENDVLRKEIADLSASEEALKQIIAEHGGNIAVEEKKLESIKNELANDQAVISAPTDRCTRCRRYSDSLLGAKLIDKPLTCADECASSNH